jgi:nitrogen regulatory protein P-II 2
MQLYPLKLVTIIADEVIEKRLVADVKKLGAKGYTIAKAHGEGAKGERMSEWEGENIRLETLVSESVAEKIMAHLAKEYFPNYTIIAYLSDVAVLRGEKFT